MIEHYMQNSELFACLTALGFNTGVDKHSIDLNITNACGFTPLRLAIQKKDIAAIKLLHAAASEHKYLSTYDDLVLAEVIHDVDSTQGFLALGVPNNKRIRYCIQVLYGIAYEGVCFGIVHMARRAVLAGEREIFWRRLTNIYANMWPVIEQTIYEVLLINPNHDELSLLKCVSGKLKNQFPYCIWYDVYAFFDGVALYQNPGAFPACVKSRSMYAFPAEGLLRADHDANVAAAYYFAGYYTIDRLSIYFNCLTRALQDVNVPVTLVIYTGAHAFMLDHDHGSWVFTDSNFLEHASKKYDCNTITGALLWCYSSPLIFVTRFFVAARSIVRLNQALANLQRDSQWCALSINLTKEQYLQVDVRGFNLLRLAVTEGDINMVERCFKAGIKLESHELDKPSLFYIAARNDDLAMVQLLLATAGFNKKLITQPDRLYGDSALHAAVFAGSTRIVKILVKALEDPALINIAGTDGATALHIAAQNNQIGGAKELLKVLRNNKDSLNKVMVNGVTAFYLAAQFGAFDVAEELWAAGAILNHPIKANTAVLLREAKARNCEAKLRTLFEQEKIGDTLPWFTPLHAAVCFGHASIVALLSQKNLTQFMVTPTKGISIYKLAVAMDRLDVLPAQLKTLPHKRQQYNLFALNQNSSGLLTEDASHKSEIICKA